MTTTSDGPQPPGSDPSGPSFPDTAPVALPPLPPAAELPPPPPLLSHLQPEAQAAAAVGTAEAPPGRGRRQLPADTPSGAGRVILPIALCLVGVVALGAGWVHLEADRAAEAQTRLAVAPSDKPPVPSLGTSTPSSSPAASTSPSPSPSASRTASASASPSRTVSPSSTPSTSASPTPVPPVDDRSVPVVVLNATNRTGLAAAVAARLREKGWTIAQVGNWRGDTVRLTTVFVTRNAQAAATMRRDVKPADGTLPTWPGMPKNRVVLVIGPDYPLVR
jgi:hypothetical protein